MTGSPSGERVAFWQGDDAVYAAVLPRGPILVLEGTAAAIWLAATTGPLERVADRVAVDMAVDAEEIRAVVDEFLDRLVSEGLISRLQ